MVILHDVHLQIRRSVDDAGHARHRAHRHTGDIGEASGMGLAAGLYLHEARLDVVSFDVGDTEPSHVVSSAVSVHRASELSARP